MKKPALNTSLANTINKVEAKGKRISKKKYNEELNKGSEEIKNGNIFSHEEIIRDAAQWLKVVRIKRS